MCVCVFVRKEQEKKRREIETKRQIDRCRQTQKNKPESKETNRTDIEKHTKRRSEGHIL